jgi:tRNA modification GTPase
LESLASLGAIVTPWNQEPSFLARDTIEQEAIEDLVHANSIRSTAILLDQMRGALSKELKRIELLNATGKLQEAADSILLLRQRFAIGKHLIHPWGVVLAGPPNVGKSSLLNRMLGYDRAIVHEQAGTTRDSLMERTSFDGWPIDLTDGAGVRLASEASDPIEIAGIDRTLQKAREADCVLFLVDPASGWTNSHERIYQETKGKRILVRSKADLQKAPWTPPSLSFDAQIATSALTGEGTLELQSAIVGVLVPDVPESGIAIPFRTRHLDLLNRLADL